MKVPPRLRHGLGAVFSQPALRKAGRVPYAVTLRALERFFAASVGKVEVWPRHSYVSGALVPFLSDLDVTLWLKETPDDAGRARLQRALRQASSLFPLLGEANVYVAPEQNYLSYGNIFELSRDPILLERARPDPTGVPDWAQASVFVLRQIDADYQNLLLNPGARVRKWSGHFELLAPYFPEAQETPVTLEGLVDLAARLGAPDDVATFSSEVLRFFSTRKAGTTDGEPVSHWWRVLFPQWFCHKGVPFPPISGRALDLFLAELSWEIWGIWCQCRHHPKAPTFPNHLKKLSEALRSCAAGAAHPALPKVDQGLTDLCKMTSELLGPRAIWVD